MRSSIMPQCSAPQPEAFERVNYMKMLNSLDGVTEICGERGVMTAFWLLMAMASGYALASDAKPPEQAARGEAIFFGDNAVARCGSCHFLAGKGTAVGPDISRLARLSPSGIATAIRATLTEYVKTVKLISGSEFPGMPVKKDTASLQYYDLSSKPPILRKLAQNDVASTGENATWKHPPASAGFTAQQFADVIAYIKWASYGDTKVVNLSDI